MEIIVSWMDGLQETCQATKYGIDWNSLNIYEYSTGGHMLLSECHIPLVNVRVWKPVK